MVGPNVGQDFGGVLNRDSGSCPENLGKDWEYYIDWTDSWEEDWTMEASCGTSGPTPDPDGEPCTWGHYCDDCAIWNEANGVRYVRSSDWIKKINIQKCRKAEKAACREKIPGICPAPCLLRQ